MSTPAYSNGSNALKLHPINLVSIAKGGYHISYSGKVPVGTTLWLGLPDATNAMDVSGKPSRGLLDAHNLPKFLSLIGARKWWGNKSGECQLLIKQGLQITPGSNSVTFPCPVKPLVCRHRSSAVTLGLNRIELQNLKYAGDDAHGHYGRSLHIPAIDGCFYFQNGHGPTFETDDNMRGLVCTTYVSAVFGAASGKKYIIPSSWTGTDIASQNGGPFHCKDVGIKERQPLPAVKDFLIKHTIGTYLIGSDGHIVLAVNGSIHEFTNYANKFGERGYHCTPVPNWNPPHRPHHHPTWTIGQPQMQL